MLEIGLVCLNQSKQTIKFNTVQLTRGEEGKQEKVQLLSS